MKMRNIVAGALLVGSLLLPSATVFAREPQPGDDRGGHGAGHGRAVLTMLTLQRGEPQPGDDHGNDGGGHR